MKISLACAILALLAAPTQAALIVSDDFNRANSETLGTTTTGGFTWNESETVSTGLRISGDTLTAGSTTPGREYATVNLSGAPNFSTTLSGNESVTWAFNMRQTRMNPSGFNSTEYGIAFILSSSSSDPALGQGYAVVLGQGPTTAPDQLRLTRFNNGPDLNSNFSDIIAGGAFTSEHLNIKVTYQSSGNLWSLYAEAGASFSDPTLVSTQIGSTTGNSIYTGTDTPYSGVLWNHNTSGTDFATFDNYSIQAVPEPEHYAAMVMGALMITAGIRTWRQRKSSSPPPTGEDKPTDLDKHL